MHLHYPELYLFFRVTCAVGDCTVQRADLAVPTNRAIDIGKTLLGIFDERCVRDAAKTTSTVSSSQPNRQMRGELR